MKNIKVLFVSSEALPFSKTGGLADVVGSLPQSLKRKGVDCRIVTPLYGAVSDPRYGKVSIDKQNMKFINSFNVPVSWRKEYCGIYEAEYKGVTYYLIDNEHYFKRNTLYEEHDNVERFTFFSRAALEILPYIDFKPDVINANDWHSALVPVFQHAIYSQSEWYAGIKTAFTIHNIAFQGKYGFEILDDIIGLPESANNIVEYDGCVNLMKGAIETAHSVITVSPNYANEIAGNHSDTSGYDFGMGLTPIINSRAFKLLGILNGLDKHINPVIDKNLYMNYDVDTFIKGKARNKRKLQERLGLELRRDVALIGIVTRIDSEQKGCQLIIDALKNGLMDSNNAQFVLLGSAAKGDEEGRQLESEFMKFEEFYKGRMAVYIGFVPELSQKIYAASDIYLMPSKYEPCGLSQLIALKYGAIPVVRETGGLADSVKDNLNGKGNGYTFKDYDCESLIDAVNRAMGDYKDSEGWEKLTKRAMKCDFSWDASSAAMYIRHFKSL